MKIVNFQRLVRLKLVSIKNINNDIKLLEKYIYDTMNNIELLLYNNLITFNTYSLNIETLEEIITKFNKLPNIYSFKTILKNKITVLDIRTSIDKIKLELKFLCEKCGLTTIYDIIYLSTNLKPHYFISDDLLNFVNSSFKPINFKIYSTELNTEQKLIVYKNIEFLEKYDSENLSYKEISFKLLYDSKTIIEFTRGSRIYIPISKKKIIIVIDGIFINDSLNLYRKKTYLKHKMYAIKKGINDININKNFKIGYIEQLSLRDLIIYDINKIISNCCAAYNYINDLKNNTISSLIKKFLTETIEEQRNIITLFLLLKDDIDTQYMAYLLYDLISTESYLLKPQPLSEELYNSLHWSIQKLFKIAVKKIETYNTNLLTFNEKEISYDKRIALLKVDDYVKHKAIEKYKEIMNKGGENSNKSKQYLDGLLSIPFGINKKEYILLYLTEFRNEIELFITEILHNKNILNIGELKSVCKHINFKMIKGKEIDDFFEILMNIKKIMINTNISYNLINLKKKIKNITLSQLKIIFIQINDFLLSNNLDIYNIKKKKKEIIDQIITITNNLENVDNKIKVIKLLDTNFNLNLTENLNLSYITKLNKIETKWLTYKDNSRKYLNKVQTILDKAVYAQDEAKNEILRIIAQWINGKMKGYCIGFEGPPGTGKTSLAKQGISNCLIDADGNSRPFAFVPLGGSSNGSILEGHSYTYVGSTWGKIVDILMETKCMNPIIYIDELDKISKTENGREIIGILTHLTDSSQNDEFYDKYFSGVKIDLSNVLFIFSYNNFNLIDPILADRIHRVKFNNLSKNDKIHIINNYLLPELLETVGFPEKSIVFPNEILEYIIYNYTLEGGIRKLKQKIFEIIREINLRYLMNFDNYTFPIIITREVIEDIFSNKLKIIYKKISTNSHIGLVNGLYATNSGVGGITIIESFKTFSDVKLSLTLTGQQGDVMKESMQCAKTIAWNLIPTHIKKNIMGDWKEVSNWGIHVHCPEAAVPKDGPSAGGAITLAIVSLLTGIPVKNTVALTGEIDLNGSIHAIGGLDNKIEGGKLAGVKLLLYPSQNGQDIDIIKNTNKEILENIEIRPVQTIWEILDLCLEENNITFNKYI